MATVRVVRHTLWVGVSFAFMLIALAAVGIG